MLQSYPPDKMTPRPEFAGNWNPIPGGRELVRPTVAQRRCAKRAYNRRARRRRAREHRARLDDEALSPP